MKDKSKTLIAVFFGWGMDSCFLFIFATNLCSFVSLMDFFFFLTTESKKTQEGHDQLVTVLVTVANEQHPNTGE